MPWQDNLLPASFRGAEFFYEDTRKSGGRRLAVHEFPLKEYPYNEDLGGRKREHRITGYVLGDDYMDQRDALEAALQAPGEATLVHPYRGPITVNIDTWTSQEIRDKGRAALFEFTAIESGDQPSPTSTTDTADQALDSADDLDTQLQISFTEVWSINGAVIDAATALLGSLTLALGPLLAFPGVNTLALAGLVSGLAADVADGALIALSVSSFFSGYAAACVASVTPSDETLSSRGPNLSGDPSYGLAALASWSDTLEDAGQGQAGINQTALVAFVEGSATSAIARVYAQTDFATEDDADNARDQLSNLLDGLAVTAGDAGDDKAYAALQTQYQTSGDDLTVRAKQAPSTITYVLGNALPSLNLAQRFYQDPSRAAELVSRNAAPHPLFMPTTVDVLSS